MFQRMIFLTAPKLSSWGQWSICTRPCNPENLQKRERACIYNDGRLAPAAYCKGEAFEERNCICEPRKLESFTNEVINQRDRIFLTPF